MEDESSFEDFSDATFFIPIEDEIPKKEIKKEENPFEILSMESILEDVIDMVQKVQSFLNVSFIHILCLPRSEVNRNIPYFT